jgi:hypothetical protein|tara:strand:- start:474 stop:629 length:156 start_codon:yes stop_codon:yes gene_type:complete
MSKYFFYSNQDKTKEPIAYTISATPQLAAKNFAETKQLDLKVFLSLFSVSQ